MNKSIAIILAISAMIIVVTPSIVYHAIITHNYLVLILVALIYLFAIVMFNFAKNLKG